MLTQDGHDDSPIQSVESGTTEFRLGRRPSLDGLRALAVLAVLARHAEVPLGDGGFLGVDIFFVLSGLLITALLLEEHRRSDRINLRRFMARRVRRLLPAFIAFVVGTLVIVYPNVTTGQRRSLLGGLASSVLYVRNWDQIISGRGLAGFTQPHLWSLAVEEQFYLLWPLAVLIIRKPGYLLLFISLVLVAVLGLRLLVWMNQISDLAYFNLYTFTRIDGLCIGCMIALLQRVKSNFLEKNKAIIVICFAGLNFGFFFVNRRYQFSFPYLAFAGYTTFAMMFGLLVNEAVTRQSKLINFLFNNPLLKFFGKISYGFYVFHWPVYLLLFPYLLPWISKLTNGTLVQFLVSVVATIAAIVISWLSYQYFEKYFLKLKDKFV